MEARFESNSKNRSSYSFCGWLVFIASWCHIRRRYLFRMRVHGWLEPLPVDGLGAGWGHCQLMDWEWMAVRRCSLTGYSIFFLREALHFPFAFLYRPTIRRVVLSYTAGIFATFEKQCHNSVHNSVVTFNLVYSVHVYASEIQVLLSIWTAGTTTRCPCHCYSCNEWLVVLLVVGESSILFLLCWQCMVICLLLTVINPAPDAWSQWVILLTGAGSRPN